MAKPQRYQVRGWDRAVRAEAGAQAAEKQACPCSGGPQFTCQRRLQEEKAACRDALHRLWESLWPM